MTIPVDWNFTIPYGILYPLDPDPDILRFIQLANAWLKQRETAGQP